MAVTAESVQAANLPRYSLWQMVKYFLRLGTFGGFSERHWQDWRLSCRLS